MGDMGVRPIDALAIDPPIAVYEGLKHYCGIVNRVRSADRELEKQRQQKQKAKAHGR